MQINSNQIIKLHQYIGKIYPLQVQGVRDPGAIAGAIGDGGDDEDFDEDI